MNKELKNLNLLRSFECAARHQSYSKAASELCISQAAVSQQMRQLEALLDSQLFIRKDKKMLLSQKGKTLFQASEQAFHILQKSINAITQEGIAGSLTITSTQAFIALWLMPKLHKFSALYPEIEIRVTTSPGFEDLKQQHIDLAVRFGTTVEKNTPPGYSCEYFGEDPVYPVCSAQLAKKLNFNQPADLLQTWLVSLENPGLYNWPSWFENCGMSSYQEHQRWTKVHSTDMALNAVSNGHGFTLAARYLCIEQLKSGTLVKPINIAHPEVVKRYLVFDANSAKIARLNIFIKWLKAEMAANDHQ
ncbi:LysR substrate-binding domain-containing protein [Cognaticolwellia mytili]|uniref:LysR substrate-binding domain-containing protein n=1 Tax=Cognaticolwellia mytili TaxID=1888913 RepID=UPI000A175B61|nr:LysR substrate-binding domain-containing protein [Cognaticolwellia mytili]